jgi:hypothetical protein
VEGIVASKQFKMYRQTLSVGCNPYFLHCVMGEPFFILKGGTTLHCSDANFIADGRSDGGKMDLHEISELFVTFLKFLVQFLELLRKYKHLWC